jgi:DNA-directed RNA polymerase specialized sigma24 family protein
MTDAAENVWNREILEHEKWLRTVVRSRVSSADEVDDVMQTVMTDAIAFEDRREEVRSLGPWLYRIAVNAVLQFRRTCGRRRKLHDNYSELAATTTVTEPLDLLLGSEQQNQVQTALAGMTGEDVEKRAQELALREQELSISAARAAGKKKQQASTSVEKRLNNLETKVDKIAAMMQKLIELQSSKDDE